MEFHTKKILISIIELNQICLLNLKHTVRLVEMINRRTITNHLHLEKTIINQWASLEYAVNLLDLCSSDGPRNIYLIDRFRKVHTVYGVHVSSPDLYQWVIFHPKMSNFASWWCSWNLYSVVTIDINRRKVNKMDFEIFTECPVAVARHGFLLFFSCKNKWCEGRRTLSTI